MVDSFVSFSKQFNMDAFLSFKSFHEPKDDQGEFTTDKKNIEKMQSNISTNSVQEAENPKQNTITSKSPKKTSSNPVVQCDICSVPISSQIVYDSHMKGKKHQTQLIALLTKNPQYKAPTYEELCSKKQESVVVNNQSEKPQASLSKITVNENSTVPSVIPPKQVNCHVCNVSCNSTQMFDKHVSGKKHQTKLKLNDVISPAPPRIVPNNNPSSSNYCDVCSKNFNSDDELTQHLVQKRHQRLVKEAEICTKGAADMNINVDDYKISTTDTRKDNLGYQCTICNRKFKNKIQLIEHLKRTSHFRITNRSDNQRLSKNSSRGNHRSARGSTIRGGTSTRSQSFSSFRGSNKSSERSRPYRSHTFSLNQPTQSFDQQTSNNIFGAFDPNNEATSSSLNNYYSSTKRPIQYEEIQNEYSGFYPKRTRTYNDNGDNLQDFYSTDSTYYSSSTSSTLPNYTSNSNNYSSQTSNYNNQSLISQPPWQYQTEPQYYQQQYSNTESGYMNPMYYSSNQPPLPNYEPPPLPDYPSSLSYIPYPQTSTFPGDSGNQGNNNNSFRQSFHH